MVKNKKFFYNQYFFLGLVVIIAIICLSFFSYLQARKFDNQEVGKQDNAKKVFVKRKFFSESTMQKKITLNYSDLAKDNIIQIYNASMGDDDISPELFSLNNSQEYFKISKSLDLSDYQYFYLNLQWITADPDWQIDNQPEIQNLSLIFGDNSLDNYYKYDIFNLSSGRNFIKIAKNKFILNHIDSVVFDWSKVQTVALLLASRPESFAKIKIENIYVEKNNDYLGDWQVGKGSFLGLARDGDGEVRLKAQNIDRSVAVLKKAGEADNFNWQAQISPQKNGHSGLFFRGDYKTSQGYFFYLGGVDSNEWQLTRFSKKGEKILKKGQLHNRYFQSNEKYWLRVETNGFHLTGYFSLDGERFEQLFSVDDLEFLSGGVGIAVIDGSLAYFDNFIFWE